jgi:hypothetical protein
MQVLHYNVFSVPERLKCDDSFLVDYRSSQFSKELLDTYAFCGMDSYNFVYDRTGIIPHYMNIKPDLAKIPDASGFSKSFEQVVKERAIELLALNKPISVVWSGGIDSTLALLALIKYTNDPEQITVYGTYTSILESGNLFEKYILPSGVKHHIKVSSKKEFTDPEQIYVTGFMGNQLFGPTDDFSSKVSLFHHQFNNPDPLAPYEVCIDPEKLEFLKPTIVRSPKKIETVRDLRWFFIFNFDWYTAKFESLVNSAYKNNVYHFFDTEDFQRYAITTKDPFTKEVGNALTHRWVMRELIEDYSGNSHYAWNKTKGVSNLSNLNPSWLLLLEDYSLVVSKPN